MFKAVAVAIGMLLIMSGVVRAELALPQEMYLLIDISDTSPYIPENGLKSRVGKYLLPEIEKLPYGSRVTFHFIQSDEVRTIEATILDRDGLRHANIVNILNALLKSVPDFLSSGALKVETESHLLEAILDTSILLENKPATIVLLSDGLEFSSLGNAYKMIESGHGSFPDLHLNLANIRFFGLGIGFGISGDQKRCLHRLWRDWLKNTGAQSIKLLATY